MPCPIPGSVGPFPKAMQVGVATQTDKHVVGEILESNSQQVRVNMSKEGGSAYEVSHQAVAQMLSDKFYRGYLYCVIEKMLQMVFSALCILTINISLK